MRSLCLAVLALSLSTGCTLTHGVGLLQEPVTNYKNLRAAQLAWRNRIQAYTAYCGQVPNDDFERGWKAGYFDIASGREGCRPVLPPRRYWSSHYQNPDGHQKINTWYQGWDLGIVAAREDGIGNFAYVPTSKPYHISSPVTGGQPVGSALEGQPAPADLSPELAGSATETMSQPAPIEADTAMPAPTTGGVPKRLPSVDVSPTPAAPPGTMAAPKEDTTSPPPEETMIEPETDLPPDSMDTPSTETDTSLSEPLAEPETAAPATEPSLEADPSPLDLEAETDTEAPTEQEPSTETVPDEPETEPSSDAETMPEGSTPDSELSFEDEGPTDSDSSAQSETGLPEPPTGEEPITPPDTESESSSGLDFEDVSNPPAETETMPEATTPATEEVQPGPAESEFYQPGRRNKDLDESSLDNNPGLVPRRFSPSGVSRMSFKSETSLRLRNTSEQTASWNTTATPAESSNVAPMKQTVDATLRVKAPSNRKKVSTRGITTAPANRPAKSPAISKKSSHAAAPRDVLSALSAVEVKPMDKPAVVLTQPKARPEKPKPATPQQLLESLKSDVRLGGN